MLFTNLLSLSAFVATVAAGVIGTRNDASKQDLAGVLNVLDRINTGMAKLGSDTRYWQGEPEGAQRIVNDGTQIVSDLGVGAKFIEHTTSLGTMDSLQMLGPMNTLNSLTDAFTSVLVQKKNFVDRLGMQEQAITLLEHARHGALDLSREVAFKLPVTTSWAASPTTNQIVDKLDKAIKVFGGGNGAAPASAAPPNSYNQPSNQWGQGAPQGQYQPNQSSQGDQPGQYQSQPAPGPQGQQGQWDRKAKPAPSWPNHG